MTTGPTTRPRACGYHLLHTNGKLECLVASTLSVLHPQITESVRTLSTFASLTAGCHALLAFMKHSQNCHSNSVTSRAEAASIGGRATTLNLVPCHARTSTMRTYNAESLVQEYFHGLLIVSQFSRELRWGLVQADGSLECAPHGLEATTRC